MNSALSKVITRLINRRMTEIVEREGMLEDTQFGFRKARATQDAIMIFNTVLTEAKLRKIDLYLSFIDLEKAYDRVSRTALFAKLRSLGFGGRVYDLIRDMYDGDSLFIQINGELCKAMFLTRGVKQGCNLSPLFFNLLMIDMAAKINASRKGCPLGEMIFSGACFADDIGLVSSTRDGLTALLEIVEEEGAAFDMRISAKKSKVMILRHGKDSQIRTMPMNLEIVEQYKYLGVQLEARPTAIFYKHFEKAMLKKAVKYRNVVRAKSRSFPDPGYAAFHLWHMVALPAIMYGLEMTDVSKRAWAKLESIHCSVGKFVVGLPRSTQNVAAYLTTGMEPLWLIAKTRLYAAAIRLIKSDSEMVGQALNVAQEQGERNLFYRQYDDIIWGVTDETPFTDYRQRLLTEYLEGELRRVRKTSFMFLPLGSFALDSEVANLLKAEEYTDYCRFVFCNSGLGNRAPSSLHFQNSECLVCAATSVIAKLNEQHILLVCPRYDPVRARLGMNDTIEEVIAASVSIDGAYSRFWGKYSCLSLIELRRRLQFAKELIDYVKLDTEQVLQTMQGN